MVHSFPACPQIGGVPGGSPLNSLGCLGPLGPEQSSQGTLCTHVQSQRVPRTGWSLTWVQQPWLWTRWFPVPRPCLVIRVPPAQTLARSQGGAAKTPAPSDTSTSMLNQQVLSSLRALGVIGVEALWWLRGGSRAHREKASQGEPRSPHAILSSHPKGQGSSQSRMLCKQGLDAQLTRDQCQIWGCQQLLSLPHCSFQLVPPHGSS